MNYRHLVLFLCIAGLAITASALMAAPQQTSTGTVSPDPPGGKTEQPLSLEERERLLSLTRVVVGSATRGPGRKEQPEDHLSADEGDIAKQVEALDHLLAKMSRNRSRETSDLMLKALDSPEPSMRITALQWLVGREDVAAEAIARGILDRNLLVREISENFLVVRGASDEAIEKVRAAREKGSESVLLEVRQAIAAIR
jgi:hypothetical protein